MHIKTMRGATMIQRHIVESSVLLVTAFVGATFADERAEAPRTKDPAALAMREMRVVTHSWMTTPHPRVILIGEDSSAGLSRGGTARWRRSTP